MFLEDVDLLFEVLDVEGAEALMANSWIVTRGIRIEGWVMMVVRDDDGGGGDGVDDQDTSENAGHGADDDCVNVGGGCGGGGGGGGGAAAAAAAGVVVVVVVVVGTGDGLFVRPAMPTVCGVALHRHLGERSWNAAPPLVRSL